MSSRKGIFFISRRLINDVSFHLEQMKNCRDPVSFRATYNAFVNSSRAVIEGLKKDGRHQRGWNQWWDRKRNQLENDNLLRYFNNRRANYFHGDDTGISVDMTLDRVANASKSSSDGLYCISFGPDGATVTQDIGTPWESTVTLGGADDRTTQTYNYRFRCSLVNPPTSHKGKRLESNDPFSIAMMYLCCL